MVLIGLSIGINVIETEPAVSNQWGVELTLVDIAIAVLFAIEYALRAWCVTEQPTYHGILGRLRYMLTPMALIDLAAFVPTLITLGTTDLFLVRIVKFAQMVRLGKFGRYSHAFATITLALRRCRAELIAGAGLALLILTGAATVLYFVEGEVQPDQFGSIPRALWWSAITLTTVGYGDVVPITPLGKVMGGLVAIASVGIVALPSGIIAASFVEARRSLSRKRRTFRAARERRSARPPT
jgi:voltage-gated potassium channel